MLRSLLILLLSLQLSAEEADFSLVNQTKSPIPCVAGSVNIVSGNWVDQVIHHETSGPDPYVVAHSYVSSSLEEGTLADGWDFYHPSDLEVFQPKGINYNRKGVQEGIFRASPFVEKRAQNDGIQTVDNEVTLFYRDAGGATVVFKGNSSSPFWFEPKLDKTGYMLLSSIDNPVRRDVKRTRLFWDSAHDRWILKLGDGTRRTYSRADKHKYRPRPDQKSFYRRCYHIKEELLPSGNLRQYRYDSDNELAKILTLSSDEKHVLHSVSFHRHRDEVKVKSSEGLTTHFSLKKLHDRETAYVVSKIDRPGKANISYSYSDRSSHHARRIDKRKTGAGRSEEVKFYCEGKNDAGKEVVKVSGKRNKKFFENRVLEVWTKAFDGNALSLSHAFTYHEKERHSFANVQESDGASTIYFWDKERRPVWIGLKNPAGQQVRAEHFVWGKYGQEGCLRRRTVLDESKRPLLDREFFYNQRGDVVRETLRGSFTGRPHMPLQSDKYLGIAGGEEFSWEAVYSKDGRALKTAEMDPLGNWTFYEYESSRQLMTARFTCDQKRIVKREFFTYDSSGICIESTVDDGSSRHRSHFTDFLGRPTKGFFQIT